MWISILPPSEVNLIELERILIKICEILNLSTYILHGLMPLKDILKSIFLLSSCIFIQFSIYFDISQDVNNKFKFTIKRIFLN